MDFQKILLFFSIMLLISACDNEPNEPRFNKQHLIGKWELTDAWRNSKRTETLTGTYYEFQEQDIMITNLTPDLSEQQYKYEFDGKSIIQKGEPEIIYTLDSLSSSTLIFSMSINNFPFKLAMTKTVENNSNLSN